MTAFVPSLLAKLTILLSLGLVVAVCLRASSPALRHLLLLATLVGAIAFPALILVSPQWRVGLLPSTSTARSAASVAGSLGAVTPDGTATPTLGPASYTPVDASEATSDVVEKSAEPIATTSRAFGGLADFISLPVIWVAGFLAVMAWLVIGRGRLRHITRLAWPLDDADWTTLLNDEMNVAGVGRAVQLRSSPAVSTPVTWGWRAPVVLLPEDALDWPQVHRRIVLRHELAHVARADALSQLVAGFACALYWFHPLVWIAERRLRAECERACDDTVVSRGTPAAEYAAHLLEVARSARAFGAAGFLSVAMARPSQLEGRLLSVLNESRRRIALSRAARVVAVVVAILLLVPLAAFRPVAREASNAKMSLQPGADRSIAGSPVAAAASRSEPEIVAATSEPGITPLHDADTTFRLSVPAKSGGTLMLDLRTGGEVVVTGWDRPEIGVQASLGGRDWKRTRVSLRPTATGAELESVYTGANKSQSSHHVFEISVPRNYNVDLRSAGGSLSLTGLNGRFTGRTGGGDINISTSSGEADIKTGGGEVHVRDSRLDGSVSTGGGTVRIEGVTGDFKGYSGGGPVIVSKGGGTTVTRAGGVNIIAMNSGSSAGATAASAVSGRGAASGAGANGAISVSTAGGALSIPSAPEGARITTGGGPITVGPSSGRLYVSTGGGRIDVGPASGSVTASTGAGDVTIELQGAAAHTVNVFSGTGKVTLLVPANLDAELDLETAFTSSLGHKTRIVSDFPLQTTESPDWDTSQGTPRKFVRARQSVGRGGGVIRVRTVNGDVVVRRKS
jgi:beta-lactamase regulating signal transducer with metallopeptidase domain/DUF4097 and DUF4098 domain-containing protein YvlB